MMECNKEEAIRAKEIAEKRMINKDFLGARKVALKAQQLCPDLENISQMIVVCDVHCSAENKLCGAEKDWYGILNIEPSADESSIKKQYRKFALLLHPDKNNFAGSTDAFKLIGEAQMVLLDHSKRVIYDNIYKASKASGNSNVGQQTGVKSNFVNKGFNPKSQPPQRPAQQGFSNDQSMFWTLCPSCCLKYRFRVDLLNKPLWCPTCKIFFRGKEIKAEATPTQTYASSCHAFQKQKKGLNKGFFEENLRTCRNSVPKGLFQKNKNSGKRPKESVQMRETLNKKFKFDEACGNVDVKIGKGCGEYPQRCTQSKLHSYYSKMSTGDPFSNQEVPRVKTPASPFAHLNVDIDKMKLKESGFFKGSSPSGEEEYENDYGEIEVTKYGHKSISEIYKFYPDADFHDFEKDRREECFRVGEIWAIHDTIDSMPRFYACVKEVILPGFKLLITWLEPDPDNKEEVKWVYEGLPVSCGRFKYGNSDTTEDHLMFSHLVSYVKDSRSNTYRIFPRKGEIWALFKNWNIDWKSNLEDKKYEFEAVEILSDYAEDKGVSVAYMGKVKGFSCLFCRVKQKKDSFQIPPNHLFRFSHRIPSFQMSGEERDDVPKGSFELDPASLPPNLELIENMISERMCLDSDFEKDESEGCFAVGQIWAAYDILDAMPRFYARVEEIFSPDFKLQITWLEPDPDDNEEVKWVNEGLPVSCGNFKLGNPEIIEDRFMLSHLVLGGNERNDTYRIYPRKGETWALFKKWDIKWHSYLDDKRNYEFEFVEVLSDYDKVMGVLVAELAKVNGFSCLFCRAENEKNSFQVPPNQLLRFSHRVPLLQNNGNERNDVPNGSFELDPASLPPNLN